MMVNDSLRHLIAADLTPVRTLRPPLRRVVPIVPLAVGLLVAAPLIFEFRDLAPLGWTWSWGASMLETVVGLAVIALALREAVPGRNLPAQVLIGSAAGVALLFVVITLGAWSASPVMLARGWWQIGAMCAVASAASALPAAVLGALLVVRAYPVRPALAGAIVGLGAGLLADAGWRLFCHFSEPAHVVAAHFGGVLVAAVAGACLVSWLVRREYRQIPG